MGNEIEIYQSPIAMEPLLPRDNDPVLAELSRDLWLTAGTLVAEIPAEQTREEIVKLVRHMNSYYSNLIEGHKTYPRDIQRSLAGDFSDNRKERNNQRLHLAHIEVDALLREKVIQEDCNPYSKEFLCWIHREFYQRLPEEFRWSETTTGKKYKIAPGEIRNFNVDVGQHTPPHHQALDGFLQKFEEFYASRQILPTQGLIAAAAAHHRLAWIHPFGDGNGRVARLFSHALMIKNKVAAGGLWTISRGLARYRQDYYTALANADRKRHNDYDGRGNLSQQSLTEFCTFFLKTARDQITFMRETLQLNRLEERIGDHVLKNPALKKHREEVQRLLTAVLRAGELKRGQAPEVTGKGGTVTREILKTVLAAGLLQSDSPKGLLRLGFPPAVWDDYFPKLFLDLPSQA